MVFDIGANVGYYTLLSSVKVGTGGKVFALEPSPRCLAFLKRHIELNSITNVEVFDLAVAGTSTSAKFEEGPSLSMGRISAAGDVEIRTASLDDLVLQGRIPLPHVIKMDIEGAEYDALQGARKVLTEGEPVLFLSTHGRAVHEACCRFLSDAGYEVKALFGGDVRNTDELIARKTGRR